MGPEAAQLALGLLRVLTNHNLPCLKFRRCCSTLGRQDPTCWRLRRNSPPKQQPRRIPLWTLCKNCTLPRSPSATSCESPAQSRDGAASPRRSPLAGSKQAHALETTGRLLKNRRVQIKNRLSGTNLQPTCLQVSGSAGMSPRPGCHNVKGSGWATLKSAQERGTWPQAHDRLQHFREDAFSVELLTAV